MIPTELAYSFRPAKCREGYYWCKNLAQADKDDYLVHPELGCEVNGGNGCADMIFRSALNPHHRCKHHRLLRLHLGLPEWGWIPGEAVDADADPFADEEPPPVRSHGFHAQAVSP
jgi:hypothetical protein